jgi:hypothetical protein
MQNSGGLTYTHTIGSNGFVIDQSTLYSLSGGSAAITYSWPQSVTVGSTTGWSAYPMPNSPVVPETPEGWLRRRVKEVVDRVPLP